MQPSTHVTHIPEVGTTEPSVRFFVRVAAVALIFVNDICVLLSSILFDLTGYTRAHIAHHIIERFLFDTGRTQVGAPSADGHLRLSVGTPELAGGTDIDAASAETALLGFDVERRAE
jgi:hypothetical protein